MLGVSKMSEGAKKLLVIPNKFRTVGILQGRQVGLKSDGGRIVMGTFTTLSYKCPDIKMI